MIRQHAKLPMISARHFYITTIPALGELGSSPPIGLADLLERIEEKRPFRKQLEALLLLDDLLQREAFLAGEIDELEPAVLSLQQAQGEAPLPEALRAPEEAAADQTKALAADLLWERYFCYVHQLARSRRSRFLAEWVEFEVALRNALAAARARRLGLEESDYQVAADLAHTDEDLAPILSEWEAAPTPLAGLRVIIRARWSWIERHDAWFSFSDDEVLVFVARLMLLEQWRRSEEKEEAQS
jgi:hypothetical protein